MMRYDMICQSIKTFYSNAALHVTGIFERNPSHSPILVVFYLSTGFHFLYYVHRVRTVLTVQNSI